MYDIDELVLLAKRENNNKRPYLYVNPIQGKHIPVEPEKMIRMCQELVQKLENEYYGERLFVIGFAETATAIASCVTENLTNAIGFVTTTREQNNGADFLYFTEVHSHATEQRLNVKGIERYLSLADRIVFVEDEVTTGNTIIKLIKELERKFPDINKKYSIASVLNSMNENRIMELNEMGIHCVWLKKLPFEYHIELLDEYNQRKENHICTEEKDDSLIRVEKFKFGKNVRNICEIQGYVKSLNDLCVSIAERILKGKYFEKMLVLGTEEFMYPAIKLAAYIKECNYCNCIRTHSTTRSPIMAFDVKGYPLYKRYQLVSVYENERTTYIYNLESYDKVIVLTDSKLHSEKGIRSIVNALKAEGCKDITVCQWEAE